LRIFDRFFVLGGRFFGVFERFTLSQKTQIAQILINIKIKQGLHAIALDHSGSSIDFDDDLVTMKCFDFMFFQSAVLRSRT